MFIFRLFLVSWGADLRFARAVEISEFFHARADGGVLVHTPSISKFRLLLLLLLLCCYFYGFCNSFSVTFRLSFGVTFLGTRRWCLATRDDEGNANAVIIALLFDVVVVVAKLVSPFCIIIEREKKPKKKEYYDDEAEKATP